VIAIIDYGAGNLRSVGNAISRLGYQPKITSDPGEVLNAGVVILPSVGAGTLEDLYQALVAGKADAVLAASIFHYGTYSIGETKKYSAKRGIPIRI